MNKTKSIYRILAILMAFAMVLTMQPHTVNAAQVSGNDTPVVQDPVMQESMEEAAEAEPTDEPTITGNDLETITGNDLETITGNDLETITGNDLEPAEPAETCEITFDMLQVDYIEAGWNQEELSRYNLDSDSLVYTSEYSKDKIFFFRIQPSPQVTIDEVRCGEAVLTADEDGIYALPMETAETQVDDISGLKKISITASTTLYEEVYPKAEFQENAATNTVAVTIAYSKQISITVENTADNRSLVCSSEKTEQGITTGNYEVEAGTLLRITAVIQKGYDFTGADFYQIGEYTWKYCFTAEEDRVLDLKADARYRVDVVNDTVLRSLDLSPAPAKNVVSKNAIIRARLFKGEKQVNLERVEVTAKNMVFTEEEQPNALGDRYCFKIPERAAGKELTLTCFYKDGEEEKSMSYRLFVEQKLTSVTVDGAKNREKEQCWSTEKGYKLKQQGSKDYSQLSYKIRTVEGSPNPTKLSVYIDIKEKMLYVTTPNQEEKAEITIYSSAERDEEGKPKEMASLTVTTVKPTLQVRKVECSLALHDSVTLKLTTDKNLEQLIDANLYFKIEAVPKEGEGKPESAVPQTIYRARESTVQTEKILLCNAEEGKNWDYDFKVSLIQSTAYEAEKVKETEGNNNVIHTGETVQKTFATRNPYYEDKLSLIKKTTTIYTGQQEVLVAVPKYSKNATWQEVGQIKVYDSAGKEVESGVTVKATQEGILVSTMDWVETGKYRLEVYAKAGEDTNMYAANASLTITLVKGISGMEIYPTNVWDTPIYKANNKAATYTFNVKFIDNKGKTYQPKSQKLKYTILGYDRKRDRWTEEALSPNLAKYTTIKNGKIIIDKKYTVSSDPEDNCFRVRVEAADYEGQEDFTFSGCFTVTTEKTEIGELYLAKQSSYEKWTVLDKESFYISEIKQLKLIATKKEAGQKAIYEEDDLLNAGQWRVTFNSNNATLNDNGQIEIQKPIEKLTLTATTTDGGKKSVSKTIKVPSEEVAGFVLTYIQIGGASAGSTYDADKQNRYIYKGSSNTNNIGFAVRVKKSSDAEPSELPTGYNYALSVEGGKIVTTFKEKEALRIQTSAKQTKVTITDKQNGNKKTVFIFENENYTTMAAPSVSIEGDCYAGMPTVLRGTVGDEVPDNCNAVFIETDATDKSTQKQEQFGIGLKQWEKPALENGKFSFDFLLDVAGSCKLNISFGTLTNGKFTPLTKPKSVRITCKGIPEYKPTSSYTIDDTTGFVALTGKTASNFTQSAYAKSFVKNANVKGQPNRFAEYFEVDNGKLKSKQPLAGIAKDNLTGYISYYDSKTKTQKEAKITVKVKKNVYKASSVVVSELNELTGITKITEGKKPIHPAQVYAEFVQSDKAAGTVITTRITEEGNVSLTVPSTVATGNHKIALYVIPEGYPFIEAVDFDAEKMKKIGIKTQVSMNVK